MEKLQGLKDGFEEKLKDLEAGGKTSFDRIVDIGTLDTFAHHYRKFVLKDADFVQRKELVKKFVNKVEVGIDTVKIHFIVDQDHYNQELALKRVGSAPLNFKNFSSSRLTSGARSQT